MDQYQFTQTISKYSQHLFEHAIKFTRDEDDAKDLVQETLIKGMRFCKNFADGTNLKGWLYVIMKNTFINDFRKTARKKEVITTDDEISNAQLTKSAATNNANTTFAMEDISKAMASIKPEYSIPFQLYFEGYKYEEIAEQLDIPLGTVKTHIHQARHGLQKYLSMYRK
ncbi:MAG: RNA polymerase sigma factor [Pedobacter agri]|uniref:RNA polymerase sigma factor n=2 Tax=Pedobacter agri TaxID=454586 RepID=A0A9X3DAS9_9SPHI|nr:RNA polymerase sigma factor [Pedobacter agri]MCX3263746.1 RNA polymerase sigma factor [Pedobacter agri]